MSTCKGRRWWDKKDPGHTYADCRRNPPLNTLSAAGREVGGGRVHVEILTHRHASWPNTHEDDWCGEWEAHGAWDPRSNGGRTPA